ncbi:MAG: hypothetical protein KDD47_17165 [Acidobacteria bacterium]|nr:hypothetical protein [Acidobacteriota bacterium]
MPESSLALQSSVEKRNRRGSFPAPKLVLRLTVAFVAACLGTPTAQAFSKAEHSQLSNLGLWLAAAVGCPGSQQDPASCEEALALLHAEPGELDFGAWTRAGDFFTHTERIVPDPAGCQQQHSSSCPKELFSSCQELDGACYEKILEASEERIQDRQAPLGFFLRFTATHRNKSHFREFAADLYSDLHARAITQSEEGHSELALRTEAVALHFLQDLFAPGHLASARADFSDPASGSLHDRFNHKGLPFWVQPGELWCRELIAAQKVSTDGLRSPPDPSCKRPLRLEREDLEAFAKIVGPCEGNHAHSGAFAPGAPAMGEYHAFGDGALLDDRSLDENDRIHRTFLVLASAWSIRQVLNPPLEAERLGICFQRQSARTKTAKEGAPGAKINEVVDRLLGNPNQEEPPQAPTPEDDGGTRPSLLPDWDTIWPPGAVLGQGPEMRASEGLHLCQPETAGAVAGYRTCWGRDPIYRQVISDLPLPYEACRVRLDEAADPRRSSLRALARKNPYLSVLEFAWSPIHWGSSAGGDATGRWEAAWTFTGTVPDSELEQRGDDDTFLGEPFEQKTRYWPLTWGLAVHYEDHRDFQVLGAGLAITGQIKLGRKRDWDLYIAVEPGYAETSNAVRSTTRWQGSLRVGVGFSALFGEIGAERAFALDAAGDGHREWRYFSGVRIRFSTSWLRKIGG